MRLHLKNFNEDNYLNHFIEVFLINEENKKEILFDENFIIDYSETLYYVIRLFY